MIVAVLVSIAYLSKRCLPINSGKVPIIPSKHCISSTITFSSSNICGESIESGLKCRRRSSTNNKLKELDGGGRNGGDQGVGLVPVENSRVPLHARDHHGGGPLLPGGGADRHEGAHDPPVKKGESLHLEKKSL